MQETIVIGITGKAGSGKDEACKMIYTMKEGGRYVNHLSFASTIKNMARVATDWDEPATREDKEAIDPKWGMSPRMFWQELGSWGRSKDPDFWIKALQTEVDKNSTQTVVITDVRYDNEAQWIKDMGGIIWEVVRDDAPEVRKHESENGIMRKHIDFTIENNGTLEDLQKGVGETWSKSMRKLARDIEGRVITK